MKLSKKASEKYLSSKNFAVCPITWDYGIYIYELDVNGDFVIWGYSDENICHTSKLKYKDDSYVFRVGHTWYDINDFYNVYGI